MYSSSSSASACMAWACFAAVLLVLMLLSGAAGTEFIVGGKAGWVRPAPANISYQDWAAKYTFQVNDTLVFQYDQSMDSVVPVSTAEEFNSCTPSNRTVDSREHFITVFRLPAPGKFYFVSGCYSNCKNGEKLSVVVVDGRLTHSPSPTPVKQSFSLDRLSCCQIQCCDQDYLLCCEEYVKAIHN